MEWFGLTLTLLSSEYERVNLKHPEHFTIAPTAFVIGYVINHVPPAYTEREQVAIGITGKRLDKVDERTSWCIVGPEPTAILEFKLPFAIAKEGVLDIR